MIFIPSNNVITKDILCTVLIYWKTISIKKDNTVEVGLSFMNILLILYMKNTSLY